MDRLVHQVDQWVEAGEQTLTISGGEPTLYRKKLIQLTERARKGGIRFIELQTNATLIDESFAQELAEAGVTSAFVSLLSDIPELHDELAGLSGAFDLCIRGIDALLAAGIRVALNPVTAEQTEARIDQFVTFVAERFPEIRSISLSAVQPHGRAARNLNLLPDYAVLSERVPVARSLAESANIELLNPYCGLPLCIGWKDDLEHCVEVFEAERGGFDTPGLNNLGNKSQSTVCHRCALRTTCGGAWHAYWSIREGSGISPPQIIPFPWEKGSSAELISFSLHHANEKGEIERPSNAPQASERNRWLWTPRLSRTAPSSVLRQRFTDIAIDTSPSAFLADRESLKVARQLAREVQGWQPQRRVRLWIAFRAESVDEMRVSERACQLAFALGASGVRLLGSSPALAGTVHAIHMQLPLADCEQTLAFRARPWDRENKG